MVEEAAPEGQPAEIVNTDGTFVENWQTMLSDETLHTDQTLPRIKNVESLAKSYVHVRKQVPLDKIAKPNEHWSDDDWNEWYAAGGRPETPQDYQMAKPDDWPEDAPWQEELIEGYQNLFHKLGLSTKQVEAIFNYNNELAIEAYKASELDKDTQFQALVDGLHKMWGAAYEQNVHRGNVAMSKDKDAERDPEYHARLVEKINRDPDLLRFASNMGAKFMEDKLIEDPGVPTPVDLQEQISKLRDDPRFMSTDINVRRPIIEKINKLTEQMLASRKTG